MESLQNMIVLLELDMQVQHTVLELIHMFRS